MEKERIQRYLSRIGIASRRQVEQLIRERRIVIDGGVAKLGDKVDSTSAIKMDGKVISHVLSSGRTRILLYHKSVGEICTRKDKKGRKLVFDQLPQLAKQRWVMVGRLDINTSGLMVFTTDGQLAYWLMHPKYQVEREYAVRVFGHVDASTLKRLISGVKLEDGMGKFESLLPQVDWARGSSSYQDFNQREYPQIPGNQWFHVVLKEGRNRLVRRLWASQHCQVNRLIRIRYGPFRLPEKLALSSYTELPADTIKQLKKSFPEMPICF